MGYATVRSLAPPWLHLLKEKWNIKLLLMNIEAYYEADDIYVKVSGDGSDDNGEVAATIES